MSRDAQIARIKEVAKEITGKLGELRSLAEDAQFGMEFEYESIKFNDWLSSDCYGEGNGETFFVGEDGTTWEESSC